MEHQCQRKLNELYRWFDDRLCWLMENLQLERNQFVFNRELTKFDNLVIVRKEEAKQMDIVQYLKENFDISNADEIEFNGEKYKETVSFLCTPPKNFGK